MKKLFLSLICMLFSSLSFATEFEPEWRVLGFAAAWHANNSGAPVKVTEVPTRICNPSTTSVWSYGGVTLSSWWEGACFSHIEYSANQRWTNLNPALGLERTIRTDSHVDKVLFGLVRDSYGQPSAMIGAARMWPLLESRVRVDVGVSALLWYRTTGIWNGTFDRKLVPMILPAMSITDEETGLGLNISFVPDIKWHGTQYSTNTLMFQTTFKF